MAMPIFIILIGLLNSSFGKHIIQDTKPLIVGGTEAPKNYAPHMMALVFGKSIINFMCGASVIGEFHVLTAAHCIDALLGDIDTLMPSVRGVHGSNEWRSTEKNVTFKGFVNHEGWNSFLIKNDIGVMFTNEKLTRNDKWNTRAIPLNYNWVGAGEKSYVTGWGSLWVWGPQPTRLQLIYVNTIGGKECEQRVSDATGNLVGPPIDQKIEICTMHPKGHGFGMCFGDSGSALVSVESGQQIGIVSWGFPCAQGAPDIFVRISGFKDFIHDSLSRS